MTTSAGDDITVALSALQHWVYCPRQCGLIYLEQTFADNIHTARGHAVHRLVDTPGFESRPGMRVVRAMPLWSQRHGLTGKADLVEFHPDGTAYPVEFKHGTKRGKLHDDVQLAAQALCLEEMLGRAVPKGAIYHASSHRRREVLVTAELKELAIRTAKCVRDMLASEILPPPVNDLRCRECSLKDICQPGALHQRARLHQQRESLFDPEA